MPKFEVVVTRTKTEIASFTVFGKTAEEAEEKVREKLEPSGLSLEGADGDKLERAAVRYFDNNPADGADNTTEFEYETEELQ